MIILIFFYIFSIRTGIIEEGNRALDHWGSIRLPMEFLNNGDELQSIMAIDGLHILLNVGNFIVKTGYSHAMEYRNRGRFWNNIIAFFERAEKEAGRKVCHLLF